jgi:hypothetical protein
METVPAFQLDGLVVDQNDAPVAGAELALIHDPTSRISFEGGFAARTMDDGRFSFSGVPAGHYRLSTETDAVPQAVPVAPQTGAIRGQVTAGVVGAVGGFTMGTGRGQVVQRVTVAGADVSGVRVIIQRSSPR